MWILPRQLHTSPFVPDTAALILDSTEQSEICAQSLLARSKGSPARTWSQRWKRDSWTQHLSGRILKPSHGQTFVTAWISSVAATRASHSAQPASDSAPKTHDTSGRIYQPELLSCDQVSVSLRMSKDISRWGCPTLSKTWQDWVTERRGEFSRRLKLARLTRGNECSCWPTTSARDAKGGYQNGRIRNGKVSMDTLDVAVQAHRETGLLGQAAPASSSSLGSRQELWLTPRANEPDSDLNFAARNADRGAHCHGTLSSQAKEQWATPSTADTNRMWKPETLERRKAEGKVAQMGLNYQAVKLWATPRSALASMHPEYGEHWNDNRGGESIATQVWKEEQWATPRATEAKCGRTYTPGMTGKDLSKDVQQWATPQAKDHKSGHRDASIVQYKQLNVEVEAKATGKLNPRWVETLMGLPIGWVMPSCIRPVTIAPTSCDSSATESCRPPQSERSEFLSAS